jgi:hypothetical protein
MIAEEDFRDWWSEASEWVQLSYTQQEKLRKVFFRVLSKISALHRERFLEESPIVICSDHKGMAVNFWRPVHEKLGMISLGIIILRHDIVSHPGFIDTVAHEAAHIVLGHHKIPGGAIDLRYEQEKGADDLSASWGFNRCYSKSRLNKLMVAAQRSSAKADRVRFFVLM